MADVIDAPLPFKVYAKTKDGNWTLKAAFATQRLAGAWAIGIATHKIEARILEETNEGPREVTKEAIERAAQAIKASLRV